MAARRVDVLIKGWLHGCGIQHISCCLHLPQGTCAQQGLERLRQQELPAAHLEKGRLAGFKAEQLTSGGVGQAQAPLPQAQGPARHGARQHARVLHHMVPRCGSGQAGSATGTGASQTRCLPACSCPAPRGASVPVRARHSACHCSTRGISAGQSRLTEVVQLSAGREPAHAVTDSD